MSYCILDNKYISYTYYIRKINGLKSQKTNIKILNLCLRVCKDDCEKYRDDDNVLLERRKEEVILVTSKHWGQKAESRFCLMHIKHLIDWHELQKYED